MVDSEFEFHKRSLVGVEGLEIYDLQRSHFLSLCSSQFSSNLPISSYMVYLGQLVSSYAGCLGLLVFNNGTIDQSLGYLHLRGERSSRVECNLRFI